MATVRLAGSRAGASGFLLKDVSPGDLVHAVAGVARGDAMLAPALTRRLLERFTAQPAAGALSDRVQLAILAYESGLIRAGQSGTA